MSANHTPWHVVIKNVRDNVGAWIARCPTPEIAAQIVREHEAHAALVVALKETVLCVGHLSEGRHYAAGAIKGIVKDAQAALKLAGEP